MGLKVKSGCDFVKIAPTFIFAKLGRKWVLMKNDLKKVTNCNYFKKSGQEKWAFAQFCDSKVGKEI